MLNSYVGGIKALHRASNRQKAWFENGVACFITSHEVTVDPSGNSVPMPVEGLFARCVALLSNKSVAAIVLVIQTDELLYSGLPVDRLDSLEVSEEPLSAWSSEEHSESSKPRRDELLKMLTSFSHFSQAVSMSDHDIEVYGSELAV
ncbi:hypothetical protein [Endozoicomonas sp.]|uniref:hypothetical protein n=1 Tax=Endozoicomonas sp. TaxID=1892382 RepID=UPI003AF4B1C7